MCSNVCPKNAITMKRDSIGFIYPKVDERKCIDCGLCLKTCAYKKSNLSTSVLETYVAVSTCTELNKSSSGGVFAAVAQIVIKSGGIVAGAIMDFVDGKALPRLECVSEEKGLDRILGSKYVQCDLPTDAYKAIKSHLLAGRKVLFGGTPCQVDALKEFVKGFEENLLTIDIVCHGVPSSTFFNSYLEKFQQVHDCVVTNYVFRDKARYGWNLIGSIYYSKGGRTFRKKVYGNEDSFYRLFLDGDIYRESCYTCKYACGHRVGDLSIGDYWGISKEHPEILSDNGGLINPDLGVSCLLVNSEKGRAFIAEHADSFSLYPSSYESAARNNGQLHSPAKRTPLRDMIFDAYEDYGYSGVETLYRKSKREGYTAIIIKNRVPKIVKRCIKKVLHTKR